MIFICKICNKKYRNFGGLATHINKKHKNITREEYYNRYLRTKNDKDVCLTCGKKVLFRSLRTGYKKYCSLKCSNGNEEKKKKTQNTCIKKYGVKSPSQSKKCIEKRKKTCLNKYGAENYVETEVFKEKAKKTLQKNYGVDNPFKSKEIRDKRDKTLKERYGVTNAGQSPIIREKVRQTNRRKLGVDYPQQSEKVSEKKRKTREKKGLQRPLDQLNRHQLYIKEVNKETNKRRKQLFKNWDGLCQYTGEKLITTKEFKKLYPNIHPNKNLLKPVIDHKISKFYGFKKNIPPEEIGHIDNLRITSAKFNNFKNRRAYIDMVVNIKGYKQKVVLVIS